MTHYLIVSIQLGPDVTLLKTCIDSATPENLQALLERHRFVLNDRSGALWSQFLAFQNQLPVLAMQPNDVYLQESIRDFLREYMDYYVSLPNIVGASGSIYGLLLAFGVLFPNDRIYLYFLFPIRAKWFVLIFGFIELASGVLGTADGVAHFAHLGGMIFGLLLIWMWRRQERLRSYRYEDDFTFVRRGRRAKTDDEFSAEKAAERKKMDEILEKVSRSGYDNLTKEEKDFLFRSSNKNTRW